MLVFNINFIDYHFKLYFSSKCIYDFSNFRLSKVRREKVYERQQVEINACELFLLQCQIYPNTVFDDSYCNWKTMI